MCIEAINLLNCHYHYHIQIQNQAILILTTFKLSFDTMGTLKRNKGQTLHTMAESVFPTEMFSSNSPKRKTGKTTLGSLNKLFLELVKS